MKLSEILPQLTAKFKPEEHKERDLPGGGKWWFVSWQTIRARLDEVCPDDWEVAFSEPQFIDKYCYMTCTLIICGTTRQAIGSVPIEVISRSGKDASRGNPIERASAESFKCACEMFGICSYLDEQTDDRTKQDFVKYMQSAGYGKPAVEYQKQVTGQTATKPKPNQNKPFGQKQADVNDVRVISDEQRKRFWTIARKAGFTDDGVKRLLYAWGFESTTQITVNAYEGLCDKAADPEMAEIYNKSPAVSA